MYPRMYAVASIRTPVEQPPVVWSRLRTTHNQHLGLTQYQNLFMPDYKLLLQSRANSVYQYFKYSRLVQPHPQISFGNTGFDATYFLGQPVGKRIISGPNQQPFPATLKTAAVQLRSYTTSSSPPDEFTDAEVGRPCSADSGFQSSDDNSEESVKERIRQVILDKIHSCSEPRSSGTNLDIDDSANRNSCKTELKQNITPDVATLKDTILEKILNVDASGDNYKADQKKVIESTYEQVSTVESSDTHSVNSETLGNVKQSINTNLSNTNRHSKIGGLAPRNRTEYNSQHSVPNFHERGELNMFGNPRHLNQKRLMPRGRGGGFDHRFAGGNNSGKKGKRPSDSEVHNYEVKKSRGAVWGSGAVDSIQPEILTYNSNEQLNQGIMKYYVDNHQKDDLFRMKLALRDVLHAIFQDAFPDCGLYIVGSSMTGFSTLSSDMDLCLMVTDEEFKRKDALQILYIAKQAFCNCSFLYNIMLIPAKVPILRFQDRISNVECDLNINNVIGIRNTHLLKYYSSVDWRLRPLMLFIKKWARFHDINDAQKMTLSSYSLSLMCIHYLQSVCRPAVLPSLQKIHPTFFSEDEDVRNLRLDQVIQFKSSNTSQVGDLFLGFLKYYTEDFDYSNDVISVRLGTKIPYHLSNMSKSGLDVKKCIRIEEPFDLSNTARSCFDQHVFSRVRRVFLRSYRKLSQTRNLDSLFSGPF